MRSSSNKLLHQTGSKRPHRSCTLANKIDNIDCGHESTGSGFPSSTQFLASSVHAANDISIGSAVLAELALVTEKQTDHTTSVTVGSILCYVYIG